MSCFRSPSRWLSVATLCAGTLALTLGCGGKSGDKYVPVKGKVMLGTSPLPGGVVTFQADAAKGNKTTASPSSPIGADGSYELKTPDNVGAPVGAYKVTVATNTPAMDPGTKPVPINPIFQDATKTPLAIEVVESPAAGAYDLKVSK